MMTYPHPSRGYREVVCTAGITESLEWVRLYPIDYRYRPSHQRFRKYQWIDVDLVVEDHRGDTRRESRTPLLDTIRLVGEPLSTEGNWRERRRVIDAMPHHSLSELETLYERERVSLGIVRPDKVVDLEVRKAATTEWKPRWRSLFQQIPLFGEGQKPLRKIPYEFRYVFTCERDPGVHRALIEDWELGVLFLKESERFGSDEAAAESVKLKFLERMCAADRETRFYVGTTFPYNTWIVLGVFWPPKTDDEQMPLLC